MTRMELFQGGSQGSWLFSISVTGIVLGVTRMGSDYEIYVGYSQFTYGVMSFQNVASSYKCVAPLQGKKREHMEEKNRA